MASPVATYRYLFSAEGRADVDVLEPHYTRASFLAGRVVLWGAPLDARGAPQALQYEVYDSAADALAARGIDRAPPANARDLRAGPAPLCFHEVIFGWRPQRLKFDIDMTGALLDAVPAAELPFPASEPAAPGADYTAAAERRRRRRADAALQRIVSAFLDEVCVVYHGRDPARPSVFEFADVAVTEACGLLADGRMKYSYHGVLVPVGVVDAAEARALWRRVAAALPPSLAAFLDLDVNASTQNFRLPGSTKDGRTLRPLALDAGARHAPADYLVCPGPDLPVFPRTLTEEPVEATGIRAPRNRTAALAAPLPERLVATILAEVREQTPTALDGHAVRPAATSDTLIAFDRVAPSHCALCNTTHDNENSLLLTLERDHTTDADAALQPYFVVEHCRRAMARARAAPDRAPPTRVVASIALTGRSNAPHERAVAPAGAATAEARLERLIVAPDTAPESTAAALFAEFPPERRDVYSAPQMRPLPRDAPTLAVRAQMKMGKTRAVRDWLGALYPPPAAGAAPLAPPVVRIVSFRVTFTQALRAALPDFVVYNEVVGDLTAERCPKLICQVESLHRIVPGGAPVDCLIVDESRSVLQQFDSGLVRRHQHAWAVFEWLVRTARRVVFLDANLGQLSARTLARLRPAQPARLVWNRHPRAAGDVYHFAPTPAAWLERLDTAIGAGQRVVVPTNSLASAEALHKLLTARHPAKTFGLYTSKTPAGVKREHFSDVHRYWAVDVLIYTPTVTAGVSFEIEHFDALYGLFMHMSCDVETCRQMMGRVRNLATREHFLCVTGAPQSLPDTPAAVRRAVRDTRSVLFGNLRESGVQFRYDDAGEVHMHESAYFHLWVELQCLANQSRNDFCARFVQQVKETGADVDTFKADDPAHALALKQAFDVAKGDIAVENATELAVAEDVPEDRACEIEQAVADAEAGRGPDVEPALCAQAARFRLREYYDWGGGIDVEFVSVYNQPAVRRVFRNLQRIAAAPSLVDGLMQIQEVEHARHVALMGRIEGAELPALDRLGDFANTANEVRDLSTHYVFLQHLVAVKLLQVCGFRCIRDERRVHFRTLVANIQDHETSMVRALEPLVVTWDLRLPKVGVLRMRAREPVRYLSTVLPLINRVLTTMYGLRIKPSPLNHFYHLVQTKLFEFGPPIEPGEVLARPRVVSQLVPFGRCLHEEATEEMFYRGRIAIGHNDPDEPVVQYSDDSDDSDDSGATDDSEAAGDSDATDEANSCDEADELDAANSYDEADESDAANSYDEADEWSDYDDAEE